MLMIYSETTDFLFNTYSYTIFEINFDISKVKTNSVCVAYMRSRLFNSLTEFHTFIESRFDCVVLLANGNSFDARAVGEQIYLSINFWGYKRTFNSLYNFI